MITYTDESILLIGNKYKGKKLKDIPDEYFIWLWQQSWFNHKSPLGRYIEDNMEAFKKNLNLNK